MLASTRFLAVVLLLLIDQQVHIRRNSGRNGLCDFSELPRYDDFSAGCVMETVGSHC